MVILHHKSRRMDIRLQYYLQKIPLHKLRFILLVSVLVSNTVIAQAPVDPSTIIGKVVCGYQGWFTCTGDGSPINRWTHWSPTTAPQPWGCTQSESKPDI